MLSRSLCQFIVKKAHVGMGTYPHMRYEVIKVQTVLSDDKRLEGESFSARRCIFELEGKRLNPYHLITGQEMEAERQSESSTTNTK